jgi:two-component system LytT family response regulator
VLVVDDEAPARRRLSRMLAELGDVEVVAQLEDAEGLLRALKGTAADVVFLDVEMPGISGVALAAHAQLPWVVFVTAHERYAVDAFEVEAVDYLLKPVRPERLRAAVDRVRTRQLSGPPSAPSPVLNPAEGAAAGPARVTSHARGLVRLFDVREIVRFWSADKYTLFVADGAEQMTEESLSALELRLHAHGFLRVHRGELVRADSVRALRSEAGQYELILADGQIAKVSRRALSAVRAALGLAH